MRCAIIEAETRDEVIREMEVRMADMQKTFARTLMNEASFYCCFFDVNKKSDILRFRSNRTK